MLIGPRLFINNIALREQPGGRTLNHINIVRDFQTVDLAKGKTGKLSFKIPKGLKAGQFKIIAFTQTKTNCHIIGATSSSVL